VTFRNVTFDEVKQRARQQAAAAIASGRLVREPCEICDGSDSQAHHEDYAFPLKVRWLCPRHHSAAHLRAGAKPWTTRDLLYLREHREDGAGAIAEVLGRSVGSVRAQANRWRISLRKPGSRKGIRIGQPRGVRLPKELRDGLLETGQVVADRLQMRPDEELCPQCGHRPIRIESLGICRVCHLRNLTDHHRELENEQAAQRELWAARQARHRSRIASEK